VTGAGPRRILAVDFGDARTGLAATDWTGTIAVPLERIDARDEQQVVAAIAALVAERETEVVVVGVPLAHDGAEGQRAQRTRAFAALLGRTLRVPVATVDESHSTDEAHERLKQGGLKASQRKRLADSVAALVILERYRASLRPRAGPPAAG
jgi:putative Holliday junction resolvase